MNEASNIYAAAQADGGLASAWPIIPNRDPEFLW